MISSNYKKGGFYKETPKQTSDQVTCRGLQKPNTRYIGLTWPMRTDYWLPSLNFMFERAHAIKFF